MATKGNLMNKSMSLDSQRNQGIYSHSFVEREKIKIHTWPKRVYFIHVLLKKTLIFKYICQKYSNLSSSLT